MTGRKRTFSEALREARDDRSSVCKFVELSDASSTYLSQVKNGNVARPTAELCGEQLQRVRGQCVRGHSTLLGG